LEERGKGRTKGIGVGEGEEEGVVGLGELEQMVRG